MPLFTFVMRYRGRTEVRQLRRSNPVGFLSTAVADAFPDLGRAPHAGELTRLRAEPMPGLDDVWLARMRTADGELCVHAVATRT